MKKSVIALIKVVFIFQVVLLPTSVIAETSTSAQTVFQEKEKYDWEKIVLLVTKKQEIETYFGNPLRSKENVFAQYDSKMGRIFVFYAASEKAKGKAYKPIISLDTVISYNISLDDPIPLSTFNYDASKFEKTPSDDGRLIYTDSKKGISFATEDRMQGEMVVVIQYDLPWAAGKT